MLCQQVCFGGSSCGSNVFCSWCLGKGWYLNVTSLESNKISHQIIHKLIRFLFVLWLNYPASSSLGRDEFIFGHPLFGLGLCSSNIVVVVKYGQLSTGAHTIVGVVLQFVAVLLRQDAMVHFKNSRMDELSQHGNVLQKGFIPGDLLQGIMGWTADSQPSLLSFCFSGNGRVGTLVKVLASIPVVDICCVVHDGLHLSTQSFPFPSNVFAHHQR